MNISYITALICLGVSKLKTWLIIIQCHIIFFNILVSPI